MRWSRSDLDAVLDGIFEAIKQSPAYTTRGRNMRAMFEALGGMALAEQPFTIEVDPGLKRLPREPRDEDYQKIVDVVRARRIEQRSKPDVQ